MNYKEQFSNRTESYLYSINKYPDVLYNEFTQAIEMLHLNKDEILVNIPAGGIPLNKYIDQQLHIKYYAYDICNEFCNLSSNENVSLCDYTNIPQKDNSVDKIICLASLHHTSISERHDIYTEFNRILKQNGVLVIGDVIKDSCQDIWLNDFVNKYNSNGHSGIFFDKRDIEQMKQHNFTVTTTNKEYDWIFNNENQMLDFIKHLFHLDLLPNDQILLDGLVTSLNYIPGSFKIKWQLIYFTCNKI
jgi:SAM-dependent methyltransferase